MRDELKKITEKKYRKKSPRDTYEYKSGIVSGDRREVKEARDEKKTTTITRI